MSLIDKYRLVLKYAGFEADEQGFISTVIGGTKNPAIIEGARMVLPISQHLRNFNANEKVIFHPLTENILRGESEVIETLKKTLNVKLNFSTGIIAQELLKIVSSPELHHKLTPEQSELLTMVSDADEKAVTTLTTLMVSGIKTRSDRLFVNIYLKRGGIYHEERHSRVGIVSFPFYNDLKDGKVDKIRVKDNETYQQLFQFIFPNLEVNDAYNFGSNSQVAPYLEALLRSSVNIASRLNDIVELYKDFIDEPENLLFDAEWLEFFDNLDSLIPEIRKIPVQHGNEGSLTTEQEQVAPVSYQQQVQQAQQQPQQQVQQPQYQQMQQPQYQQPVRPEVKQTKRGLDFKSIVQNNPALAYNNNPFVQQQMPMMNGPGGYPPNMPPPPPTWAQPQMQPPMYPQQMQQPMYPQQMQQMQQPMYPQQMQPQPRGIDQFGRPYY